MGFLSFEEFYNSKYLLGLYCRKISQGGSEFSTHSGLVFREKCLFSFHLGWHERLYIEKTPPHEQSIYLGLKGYDTELDSMRFKTDSLIGLCKLVNEKNQDMPYGLVHSKLTIFTREGERNIAEQSIGLTCATFVMSIFKSFDFELIEFDSWEARKEEDAKWKQFVIAFMRKTEVPEGHIKKVEDEDVLFRFKPEEVVSSGLKYPNDLKAKFDFCKQEGGNVLEILSKLA